MGTLLDVGCGNGIYVGQRAGFAVGADIAVPQSFAFKGRPFIVADAAHLPFDTQSFDTVSAFETIEHVDDPVNVLRELRRVTKTVGIFTVPNAVVSPGQRRSNLIFHHWIDSTHCNFFDRARFEAALREAGWRPKTIAAINTIDVGPFIVEAFRLPARLERIVSALYRRLGRPYAMTLLAVAHPDG